MRKSSLLLKILLASGFGLAAQSALAADGYWTDARGNVVKNAYGECWRSNDWTAAKAIVECDPELVPKPVVVVPPPAPKPEPKPEPVVEAPKPLPPVVLPPVVVPPVIAPPVVVAPPPAPKPAPKFEKVSLAAGSLFAFGATNLKPEGLAELDKLAVQLKTLNLKETKITVTGHTDRIGKPDSNLRASKVRAEIAKARLVEQGIPADSIVTEGKGATDPMTKAGQCDGIKARAKLIDCLQPDRRIEIDATAIRQVQ